MNKSTHAERTAAMTERLDRAKAGTETALEAPECDMKTPDEEGNVAEGPCSHETVRRGDLFVCTNHAVGIPANVGRVEGEKRCWCGGFRPVTQRECGMPCEY